MNQQSQPSKQPSKEAMEMAAKYLAAKAQKLAQEKLKNQTPEKS